MNEKENKIDIKGEYAIINDKIIVDTEDLEMILSYNKYLSINKNGYAYFKQKGKQCFLHRLLLGLPARYDKNTKLIGDHKNRNRLDNRKHNLRIIKKGDNAKNCLKYQRGNNKFKGTCWIERLQKWEVSIQVNHKQQRYGVFTNEVDAGIAYNIIAYFLHGEMASYNPLPFIADYSIIENKIKWENQRGVRFRKSRNYWEVQSHYKKIKLRIGGFPTSDLAKQCLLKCRDYIDKYNNITRETMNQFKDEVLAA